MAAAQNPRPDSQPDGVPDAREHAAELRELLADERERAAEGRVTIAETELAGLRHAMDTRAVIEQAKGMVMITLKIDAEAAFAVLIQRSQRCHRKLHEVAKEIVETGSSVPTPGEH